MANEFANRELDCNKCQGKLVCPPCDPLDTYDIDEEALWRNIVIFLMLGVSLRVFAWGLLYYKTYNKKKF